MTFGATVVALFALHGATFVAVRTTGDPRERARRLHLPALVLMLAVVTGLAAAGDGAPVPAFAIGGAGTVAVALSGLALRQGGDGRAFAATIVAAVSLPLMVGAGLATDLLAGAAEHVTLGRLTVIAHA